MKRINTQSWLTRKRSKDRKRHDSKFGANRCLQLISASPSQNVGFYLKRKSDSYDDDNKNNNGDDKDSNGHKDFP